MIERGTCFRGNKFLNAISGSVVLDGLDEVYTAEDGEDFYLFLNTSLIFDYFIPNNDQWRRDRSQNFAIETVMYKGGVKPLPVIFAVVAFSSALILIALTKKNKLRNYVLFALCVLVSTCAFYPLTQNKQVAEYVGRYHLSW